ncbi:HAMP domain-containing sensor histidine kinase [Mesorhizobium sp.]|uniref:sensor histidine kinase n=1 Tax=Mesorhizobium sp. TaxID=1871066 RepID=UPI000FE69CFC|nr:HAMP domain-containing sensor histidine kinase [Mesorhizobium sp.]RWK44473.1 MAG: HAMP domain-containing histidine kinase [Mesorhizobium sp.]RWK71509.1 MAG: HAMP domain-containing histidine kinase [Mesorhizobium sp.]RWK81977.1 MAG: HAMP domain-containing histidine kinase [Mesorhizobium sp.]RWK82945.1 MAG: HAMP domain-containing histidine kinase [Mesorhizobium sp.]RWL09496.1 MAG: HAMP domain-containing histidine kinase [Mesorhizobium sp.]
MRRDSLMRSTPFRLAIVFAVMVVVTFAVTGLAVHQRMRSELRQHQDQTIRETYSVIASAYGHGDLTDLLQAVETNVMATPGVDRIFLLMDRKRKVIGGNVRGLDVPPGWSDVPGEAIGLEPDLQYRVFAGSVDGNRLFVGVSQQELDNLQEILTTSFAWGTLVVAGLALTGGVWLAIRAQRRFNAVSQTMNAVSHGKLSARIPLIGRGDDIDMLSRDINGALARLEGTVEGMRQISADIAHDLKTPLNRLRMTVDDAIEKQQRGDPVADDLMEAAEEAERINATFEALLRISQIEAGSRRTRFGAVNLDRVASSLVDIYHDVAADEGQSLRLGVHPGPLPELSGDRELLTQMFANLIENAIRHCPRGTSINVGLGVSADDIIARVEDNGPGIPDGEREKVFRRFYRTEKSRTSPGSGLGLSLVKAVADLHDAKIVVHDLEPGLGIEIRFPRRT